MIALNETINTTGVYYKTVFGPFFLENMFIIMLTILLTLLLILVLNIPQIRQELSKINKRTWIILLIIFISGFAIRNASYEYGMIYDGIHYPEYANTWLHTGVYLNGCAIGDLDSCRLFHQTLAPAGFPFMILLIYMAFGVNSLFPMILTGIIGSLNIIIVFLISYLLFKREDIGLYSAVVFALTPLSVFIAGTGSVRSVSLFFIGLSILFFLIAMKRDKIKNWLLFFITLSFTIYVRQENSIILIPLTFLFISRYSKKREFLFSTRFLLPAAVFILSQIPVQHWIFFMGGTSGSVPMFSILNITTYLPHMIAMLFQPIMQTLFFNPISSVLFFTGIYFVLKEKYRKETLILWVWFLSLLILYSSYFQCPSGFCGDFIRYMSAIIIPYSILTGLVLYNIAKSHRVRLKYGLIFTFIILFFSSGISIPTTMFKDTRAEEPYLLKDWFSAIEKTPPDCTIMLDNFMVVNSDVLSENQRRWISLGALDFSPNLSLKELEESSCIILIYNSGFNETEIGNQIPFISENLKLEPYFDQGVFSVYNATLR